MTHCSSPPNTRCMLALAGRAAMRSSPRLRSASPRAARAVASAATAAAAAAATPGPRGVTTVRVATYNVLSSALASPSHFTKCRPEDLAAAARLPRVLAKLQAEVDRDAVICLQEVSLTWAGASSRRYADTPRQSSFLRSQHSASALLGRAALRVVHGEGLHLHPALLRQPDEQLHGGATPLPALVTRNPGGCLCSRACVPPLLTRCAAGWRGVQEQPLRGRRRGHLPPV